MTLINSHEDYGDLFPSDIGDIAPLPPISSLALIDTGNPGLVTPRYFQNPFPDPGSGGEQIDIRETLIFDSATGQSAVLATIFERIVSGTINLKKTANVDDGSNVAEIDIKFDGDSGKYKANEGFLGD